LSGIISKRELSGEDAVLNGIAYDASGDRLWVTGKLWPKLFEIRVQGSAGLAAEAVAPDPVGRNK
jgi:glutamine cyclotransferase